VRRTRLDKTTRAEVVMSWVLLVIAGLLEIVWAVGLSATAGFTRLVPSLVTVAGLIASMVLLAVALRSIPVGTGYAVWVGIGAVGTAVVGMVALDEPVTAPRVACLLLIVGGIVGLKLTSP
jgi:quaternary ammonium compound-resistance protein SugE